MYSQPWSPTPSTTALGARVAHREALAGAARGRRRGRRSPRRARCCRRSRCPRPRTSARRGRAGPRSTPPREPLARVVVRVAAQRQRDPRRQPGAERLARPSRGASTAIVSVGAARLRRGRRSPRSRACRRRCGRRCGSASSQRDRLAALRAPAPRLDQLRGRASSARAGSGSTLRARRAGRDRRAPARISERSIPARLAAGDRRRRARAGRRGRPARRTSRTPSEAIIAAHVLGDVEEVVDDVLRRAGEAAAQLRILGGDPDRAGVQVADAHHDAAGRDQRRGREADLVGAEERGDDHVAAGLHPRRRSAARRAQRRPVADERLLRLGEPDLPGDPGDRGSRRAARRRCRRRGRRSGRGRRPP